MPVRTLCPQPPIPREKRALAPQFCWESTGKETSAHLVRKNHCPAQKGTCLHQPAHGSGSDTCLGVYVNSKGRFGKTHPEDPVKSIGMS